MKVCFITGFSNTDLPMIECPVPCVQLGELLATQPAAAIATETCCSLNLPLLFSFSKFKCSVSYWHLYFILNTKREHSFIQNNLLGLIFLRRNGGKLLWRQRLFRNGKYSENTVIFLVYNDILYVAFSLSSHVETEKRKMPVKTKLSTWLHLHVNMASNHARDLLFFF